MRPNPIQPTSQLTFQYSSILKDEFKRGAIKLSKDITGQPLTKKVASLDHTIPKSKGGKSCLANYNLMNRLANMLRGNKPLKEVIDLESLIEYIIVMLNTDTGKFNGIEYLKKWLPNLHKEIKDR
jgi:hypothetical protein